MLKEFGDSTDGEVSRPAPARSGGLTSTWLAVLRDVRTLFADLTEAGAEMGRQLSVPRVDQLTDGWSHLEDAVLREIKHRLDQVEEPEAYRLSRPRSAPGTEPVAEPTPARLLDELLNASVDADSATSRDELYRALLLRLVPDEARILAVLADDSAHPLVHVQSKANGGRTVLANASTVGRAAEVQLPEATTAYVTHLRALGLVEEGPADDVLAARYDILLGDPEVRGAEVKARDDGRLGARTVRRTVRLSALGRELWAACRPDPVPTVSLAVVPPAPAEPAAESAVAPTPELDASFEPEPAHRGARNGNGRFPPA